MLVSVEYRSRPGLEHELLVALDAARFARRRSGATGWRVWQDASDPDRIVEQFVVASWSEHLRQHERVTRRDQGRFDAIRAMTVNGEPTVTHWVTPDVDATPRPPPHPGSVEAT